jgi:hypothetical protein
VVGSPIIGRVVTIMEFKGESLGERTVYHRSSRMDMEATKTSALSIVPRTWAASKKFGRDERSVIH